MPRFFRRFAEGIFDVEDLKYRTDELAGFIKTVSSRYRFGGVTDPIVARSETEKLVKMLREYRADVTLSWVNTGHSLAEREMQDAKVWFGQTFA